MPLKHHTETAYMILLGVAICVTGLLVAILPHLPVGLPYWVLLAILTFAYPLVLMSTFRTNRADYEFRLMHWFPFGIVLLWMVLELFSGKAELLHVLTLGFFFLWSLPLVALGIAFMIIFALHVIRRRVVRVTLLSLLLAGFTAGAVASEAMNLNDNVQRAVFPENSRAIATLRRSYAAIRKYVGIGNDTTGGPIASVTSSSSSDSSISSTSSVSSSAPVIAEVPKPNHLTTSGPEDMLAALAVTMLGLYFGVLHGRAEKRA